MKSRKGKVYLAGAGPGDPGLLTLRAAAVLKRAEVLIYDGLVNPALLDLCPQAVKISAAKHPRRGHGTDQTQINRQLLRYARRGKCVVRLKGGDPFIFGRGGEEAFYLKRHGIPFEIIPGVSAGQAVPAYAGIPVTDRRFASSVTFVTCHEDPAKEKSGLDWEALARLKGTLVFFMGVRNLKSVTDLLVLSGRAPETSACVIEWGTLPRQRVVEGTLNTIAAKAQKAGLHPPALTVVGDVARLRPSLKWFEKKLLFGRRILITRPGPQAETLRAALREEGACVEEFTAIRIAPPKSYAALDRALRRLRDFDGILFTSANAVDAFFDRLHALGKDARALAGIELSAIGERTAHSLAQRGVRADFIPGSFHSRQLIREWKSKGRIKGRHFLLPRTSIAPRYLKEALESGGAQVTQVTAYRTLPGGRPEELRRLLNAAPVDDVLFASASAVRRFFQRLPKPLCAKIKQRLVSIGPATSAALRELGYRPRLEAREHTLEGLAAVLLQDARKKREER